MRIWRMRKKGNTSIWFDAVIARVPFWFWSLLCVCFGYILRMILENLVR